MYLLLLMYMFRTCCKYDSVSWPRIMEVFSCDYVTRTIVDKLMYMDGKDRSAFYSYSETGFFV